MSPIQRKELRHAYGYDDVAIVPGELTVNPEIVDISTTIAGIDLDVPILASAMDAVVDPSFAIQLGRRGGLAVLNLEGLQCRFDDPDEILSRVAASDREGATAILQEAYTSPIRPELVTKRIQQIKDGGVKAAVSLTPPNTKKLARTVQEAGADVLVVQSTVTTARHESRSLTGLVLHELIAELDIPVLVGNTVGYKRRPGAHARGHRRPARRRRARRRLHQPRSAGHRRSPGHRHHRLRRRPRRVPAPRGPSRSHHHRRRYPHRGRCLQVLRRRRRRRHDRLPLRRHPGRARPRLPLGHGHPPRRTPPRRACARGPAHQRGETALRPHPSRTDGTENLAGALRTSMGSVGARTIADMQQAEMIIAPAIKTEGKIYQHLRD